MAIDTTEVKAIARYVRMSPYKVRRVLDQIRGRSYREALIILEFMPIIFATAILSLPLLAENFIRNAEYSRIIRTYLIPGGSGAWVYALVYLVSIVFFSYFYSSLIVNPVDVAQNLKKMGSSIPGIRPGKATSEYIERVLNRLTFLGAIFLGLIAIIPTAVESALGVPTFKGLGATSLLILVGVAIDTSRQIQTYVISQRYEGMVKQ